MSILLRWNQMIDKETFLEKHPALSSKLIRKIFRSVVHQSETGMMSMMIMSMTQVNSIK